MIKQDRVFLNKTAEACAFFQSVAAILAVCCVAYPSGTSSHCYEKVCFTFLVL